MEISRRVLSIAAGGLATVALAGCGTPASPTSGVGAYWLVQVSDGYGNIYNYPPSNRPAPSVRAEYLGSTATQARAAAPAAAKRLGIAHVDPGIY